MLMFARRYLPRTLGLLALLALPAALGCGSKSGHLATVSGVITHEGNPVDGAKVEFHSTTESGGKRDVVSTTTDSSGKYVIAGVGREPGIPPGMYKVVVTKYEGKGLERPQEGFDAGQIDAMVSDTGGAVKGSGLINLLPKEYSSTASTKLTATLEAGKNENVNFDLKGKAGQ
jgi:hypothetical protein